MAMHHPNLIENSINLTKYKKCPQKINRSSFWAFLFSIFIYTSIFYIFNLSPSTLLSTTNFWFFISNTLILIIAADFGSFSSSSSSSDHHDHFLEEYMRNSQERSHVIIASSFEHPRYYTTKKIENREINIPHEMIKEVILVEENKQEIVVDEEEQEIPRSGWEIVVKENDHLQNPSNKFQEDAIINVISNADKKLVKKNKKKRGVAKRTRSNLEKAIIVVTKEDEDENENEDEKMHGNIQRSQSERYDQMMNGDDEAENDELLEMSVDELNRRVEEFIQRFNRQIRLQAVARNQQNMMKTLQT